MIKAISMALSQMSDPAFRSVLWRALGASIAVFVVVWVAAWLGLSWLGDWFAAWLADQDLGDFWSSVLRILFSLAWVTSILIASFLLFPAVVSVAMGIFLDEIADAVEQCHYPDLPPARDQSIAEIVREALVFAAVTIGINLLVMPLYLILIFVPPLNLFLFYGLNGYLLGREYFEMVAVRRLEPKPARSLRRRHRGKVFLAGVIIAFVLTIPIVNLVAPIAATAFLVHIFEDLRRARGAPGV